MYWVIKVSYRKRNAAGKNVFGIRVLGVMAAVCQPCGGRHEGRTGICRDRYADSIGSGGRHSAGKPVTAITIILPLTGQSGKTAVTAFLFRKLSIR